GEADHRGPRAQGVRCEILGGLAARPASGSALAELSALEGIDAEQSEVDGNGVAVERARLRFKRLCAARRGRTEHHHREKGGCEEAHPDTISTSTRSPRQGMVQTRKGCSGLPVRTMLTRPGCRSKRRVATRWAFSRLHRSRRFGERPGSGANMGVPLR